MKRAAYILVILVLAGLLPALAQNASPTSDEGKVIDRLYDDGIELLNQGSPESVKVAIAKFLEASKLSHDGGSQLGESWFLKLAADGYLKLADKDAALDLFLRAYNARPADNEQLEADLLQNMGLIHQEKGEYGTALTYFIHERELRKKLKDVSAELGALHNAAMVLNDLGDMRSAKELYEQIVDAERSGLGEKNSLAASLNNLGYVYYRMEDYRKAAELYEEAYQVGVKEQDEMSQSAPQIGLGDAFHKLNDQPKAIEHYNRGLALARKIPNALFEGDALWGLGTVYQTLGEKERARDYYDQALAIQHRSHAREAESKTLASEMSIWLELGQPKVAILYGKQAVNLNQTIRGFIQGLDKGTQRQYLRTKEATYRDLSNILISEGRLPEAQSVLDLLKEQEYEQFSKVRSGESPGSVPYSKAEADIVAKVESLASLSGREAELEQARDAKGTLTAAEQAELKNILLDIEAANRAFRLSLSALGKAEASVNEKIGEIEADKNLQAALFDLRKELKTGVVAIYTVIGTEEVKAEGSATSVTRSKFGWAVLVTPEGRKAYPIDVTDLEQNVQTLRSALSSADYDPRPAGQKLYNAVFRQTSPKQKTTLEADLDLVFAKYRDKTIMWSLDGVLRYVPMAALYDGKSYLVEKYRSSVFTRQSLLLLTQKDAPTWETLGLGVSEKKTVDNLNFVALEGTKRELEDIVREPNEKTGILEGTRKLNKDFTKDGTMELLRERKYQAVHIASHFSFNPIDPSASFLVIGDGKLTFADIEDKDNLLRSIDLLTLSACDTAMSSNGKESEGFPFLAQSLGAKTVIASLWKVSDTGTPELMIRFYKLRAENAAMPKGEAFRQAQLSLLNGTSGKATAVSKGRRSEPISLDGSERKLKPFVVDPAKPFAHPHYWASFVLIGNWR